MKGTSCTTRIGGAAAIAALLFCGCRPAHDKSDPAVAEAYAEKLYRSDLRQVIPPDVAHDDSAALAQRYIDNWLRERVLLHKAEENLTMGQKDVERQLREYRGSLITYAYEQALVRQKLDTNISAEDIAGYYTANIKNFELKDNIVRVRWFKLRENDKRELKKVEDLWRSDKPEDRHELEVLIAQRGSTITDTHDAWMPFTELQQQVPLRPDNPTDWIPRQTKVITSDSVGTYYVDFVEQRLKDSTSPLDLVHAEIRSILINQRKLRLIERMREDLFQDALAKKDARLL